MSRQTKFTVTVVWILFTRSYDAYCTSKHTPDLSNEANPLVTVFGFGWTPLLFIIGALTLYALYAFYLATFKTKDLLPHEKGYSESHVAAYLYLGRKDTWPSIFYKFPTDFNRFNQYMGHVLTRCLVFVGFVSTIMWLLINHTEMYKEIHSPVLIYSVIIIGSMVVVYQWHRTQYRNYLSASGFFEA